MTVYAVRHEYDDEPMRFTNARTFMKWLIKHNLINESSKCFTRIAPCEWGERCRLADIFGDTWRISAIWFAEDLLTDKYYMKDGIGYRIDDFRAEPVHIIEDEDDDYFNYELGYQPNEEDDD